MTPITLRLYVHGMTLFVPDGDALHSLMPVTGPREYGQVPQHECHLYVPDVHRAQDTPSPYPLKDLELVFPASGGDSAVGRQASARLGKSGVDLFEITQEPISDDLQHSSDDRLSSRLTIPTGSIVRSYAGCLFRWRHHRIVALPYVTLIEVKGLQDLVTLQVASLDHDPQDEISLQSFNGLIQVCVANVPPMKKSKKMAKLDLDTVPAGTPCPHFAAHYGLYEDPDEVLIPTLAATTPDDVLTSLPCNRVSIRGGDPFTCVHTFASQ